MWQRMMAREGLWGLVVVGCLAVGSQAVEAADFEGRAVTQWYPFVEWQVDDVEISERVNPFDVIAWATFTHDDSGETIRTGMFYDGDGTWKFRFTGTKVGRWTFETDSDDAPELDGLEGVVEVEPNDDPTLGRGFVTNRGGDWAWSGSGKGFVPQIAMGTHPKVYYENPERIEQDVRLWYDEHGFDGIHVGILMRAYNIHQDRRDPDAEVNIGRTLPDEDRGTEIMTNNPSPDPRTFETLERLITASYEHGGFIHFWQWGDEQRQMTPIGLNGGINGEADQRMQRYMAARLGPLPGWTVGYGFDLWEWVDEDQMLAWREFMHDQMGWPHMLGARAHRHGTPLEELLTSRLDYVGYETHQPDVETYAAAIALHPEKPAFMEDRFRVRDPSPYPDKDYTLEMVRRGLWHSMIAGGVANIWGYHPKATGESEPFPNREQLKTYAEFEDRYFTAGMVRDSDRTNGDCLRAEDKSTLLFYWDDERTLRMDLSDVPGELHAVAVNALEPYEEIEIGQVSGEFEWRAPQEGDWAVAVVRQ